MRIEVLYFQGCPNHVPTVELVRQVASELAVDADLREVEVQTAEDAQRLRFLGSPSVHVDGLDVDPRARHRNDFAYGCRVYGHSGVPPRPLVKAAITGALSSQNAGCCGQARRQEIARLPQRAGILSAAASVLSAAAASACCWLPLLLLAFGVSAAGVSAMFEKVRPIFLAICAALLGLGFYFVYLRRPACAPGTACATPNARSPRRNRVVFWSATVAVVLFAFFPSYAGRLFGANATTSRSHVGNGVTWILAIDGMTCEACSGHVRTALAKVPGVEDVTVSYKNRQAAVRVNVEMPPPVDLLVRAVETAGYKATVQNTTSMEKHHDGTS